MAALIFVYGTLKQNYPQSEHARLGDEVSLIGYGFAKGKLLEGTAYPAAQEDAENLVPGEVYSVDENVLSEIDDYEGDDYFRKQSLITLDDGTHCEAWVYYIKP